MKPNSVARIIGTLFLVLLLMYFSTVFYLGIDDRDVTAKWLTAPWETFLQWGIAAVITWVIVLVVTAVRLRPHQRSLWILWSFVGSVVGAVLNAVVVLTPPLLATPGSLGSESAAFAIMALSIVGTIFVFYVFVATIFVEFVVLRSTVADGAEVTSGPVGVS